MITLEVHWIVGLLVGVFALTGAVYLGWRTVEGIRFLLLVWRGMREQSGEDIDALRGRFLSELDRKAFSRLDAMTGKAWSSLSYTRITDLEKVRDDCFQLVKEIAHVYFPDSDQPELEITPLELLRLNERVNRQLIALLTPLTFLHRISVLSILNAKTLLDRTKRIMDDRYVKGSSSVASYTWQALNALNPNYWLRRAMYAGATQVVNRRILVSIYRIVGAEAIRIYRSSSAVHLDPKTVQELAAAEKEAEVQNPSVKASDGVKKTEQPASEEKQYMKSDNANGKSDDIPLSETEWIFDDDDRGKASEEQEPSQDGAEKKPLVASLAETLSRYIESGMYVWEKMVRPDNILKEYREMGYEVESLKDARSLPIEALDKAADNRIRNGEWLSAAEGAATGIGGFLLLSADAVSLVALQIRTIQKVGYCYGFDVHRPEERIFAIKLLEIGYTHPVRRGGQALCEEMRTAVEMMNQAAPASQLRKRLLIQGVSKLAEKIGVKLGARSLSKIVPVIGAAAGAVINKRITHDIAEVAKMVYRERLLQMRGEFKPSNEKHEDGTAAKSRNTHT